MSLIKHSTFNLIGNIIPAFVTIPAFGYMARVLGLELFGIYTLAIAIVGYAGIFDGGLTRAVVREVAIYRDDTIELKNIISSSTLMIFILSLAAMLILSGSSTKIVEILNVSNAHKLEAESAIKVLALSVPFFLLGQVWLSILEGREEFSALNIQRTIGSLFLAGLPVIFLTISPNLISAMYGLLLGRIITLLFSAYCVRFDLFPIGLNINKNTIKRLIGFGSWITVSNIVSPIMSYFDRFIASHILGAQNIAYYTAPSELINKGLIIPAALTRAIFPKLISSDEINRQKLRKLGYLILTAVCGTGVILGWLLSERVMKLWMGSGFSGKPVLILDILLVGYFFNSIAQLPFSDIQAYGKAKWTAFVHIIELLPYLILIYYMINNFGLMGVAIAWSIRSFCDFIILAILAHRLRK